MPDDHDPPTGLTALFGRLVAFALALAATLMTGVARAFAEAFARAFGARPPDGDPPPDGAA